MKELDKRFEQSKIGSLSRGDKSFIGKWDSRIVELCESINNLENYFTNSSCSGRIVLIKDNIEKTHGLFLFLSHDLLDFGNFKKELEMIRIKNCEGIINFKQEPAILAISCKTIEDAFKLVEKARYLGWKRSGLMAYSEKRYVVELMCTEHIDFPIISNGKILVEDIFLKLIVEKSNENLERTWEKIEKLKKEIASY